MESPKLVNGKILIKDPDIFIAGQNTVSNHHYKSNQINVIAKNVFVAYFYSILFFTTTGTLYNVVGFTL